MAVVAQILRPLIEAILIRELFLVRMKSILKTIADLYSFQNGKPLSLILTRIYYQLVLDQTN